MKILIADKFSESAMEELQADGLVVEYNPELKERSLCEALQEEQPTVLVVRSTKVTSEILKSSTELALVVRAGAGINTIDVATASRIGIFVANCPGKNAAAVAELTMGLICAVDRRIPDNVQALRNGQWRKKDFSKAAGLRGKTLGLLGFGNIAQEVARRAQAFGMNVHAWSRSLTEERASQFGVKNAKFALDIASESDVISVHLAAVTDTKNLCDERFFDAMKNGACFVNTSRGTVVDEEALIAAMENKGIRAGLDVYHDEPSSGEEEWQSALAQHPSVYGTHHIGASTEEASAAIGAETLRIIKSYASDGTVLNCVNLETKSPANYVLNIRHLNQVGVLAAVLQEIQKADINVLEMENILFQGDHAALAKIHLSREPETMVLEQIEKSTDAILSLSLIDSP